MRFGVTRPLNNADDGAITSTTMVEYSSDSLTFSGGLRAGQSTAPHAKEPHFQPPPFLPGRPRVACLLSSLPSAASTASSLDQENKESANV